MLEPFLCGRIAAAPLLPKLRGHFAEFLDDASSVGLRILSSSTCVGLRYGCMASHSSFSRCRARALRYFISLRVSALLSLGGFASPATWRLAPGFPFPVASARHVPAVLSPCSTGISTCCPSATHFCLALGPDLPGADQLYPGILGYSAGRILTFLSLLIPAFSLLKSPLLLAVQLRPFKTAPLPTR